MQLAVLNTTGGLMKTCSNCNRETHDDKTICCCGKHFDDDSEKRLKRGIDWRDDYHNKIMQGRNTAMPNWRQRLTECKTAGEKLQLLEFVDDQAGQNIDKNGVFSKIIERFVSNIA